MLQKIGFFFNISDQIRNYIVSHIGLKAALIALLLSISNFSSAQEDWVRLIASDNLYSVQLPLGYMDKVDTVNWQNQKVYLYNFFQEKDKVWYHLIDIHYPYDLTEEGQDSVCTSIQKELIGSIAEKENADILFSDISSNSRCESNSRLVDHEKKRHVRIKITSINNRALITKVSGNSNDVNHQQCDYFFDSLKILER